MFYVEVYAVSSVVLRKLLWPCSDIGVDMDISAATHLLNICDDCVAIIESSYII